MKTKSWFRVTVDSNGRAVDCRPVGGQGTAELGVFYVLAASALEAGRLAANALSRKLLAERRARYIAEGLCRCGLKRDRPAFKTCSRCDERHKLTMERVKMRRQGLPAPKPDRRTVLLERKEQQAGSQRLEVLVEVQRAYHKMRGQGATFERWLGKQIEALTSGKAA